jgi:hypothetical protein
MTATVLLNCMPMEEYCGRKAQQSAELAGCTSLSWARAGNKEAINGKQNNNRVNMA